MSIAIEKSAEAQVVAGVTIQKRKKANLDFKIIP